MILNKIESHLNNIDGMKENIKSDIERLFSKLNVRNLLSQPDRIIDVLIFAITERITKKYIKPVLKESQRFVNGIKSKEKL